MKKNLQGGDRVRILGLGGRLLNHATVLYYDDNTTTVLPDGCEQSVQFDRRDGRMKARKNEKRNLLPKIK